MSSAQNRPWIEIDDPQLSSAELVQRVEARFKKRLDDLGPVDRHFPSFDPSASLPESDNQEEYTAMMRYYLQNLEQQEPPDTTPTLAPSPATRLPIVGRLWQLVRREAHQLVLFYVNRHLAHQTRLNNEIAGALREMAALLRAQDEEIQRLRAELREARGDRDA